MSDIEVQPPTYSELAYTQYTKIADAVVLPTGHNMLFNSKSEQAFDEGNGILYLFLKQSYAFKVNVDGTNFSEITPAGGLYEPPSQTSAPTDTCYDPPVTYQGLTFFFYDPTLDTVAFVVRGSTIIATLQVPANGNWCISGTGKYLAMVVPGTNTTVMTVYEAS